MIWIFCTDATSRTTLPSEIPVTKRCSWYYHLITQLLWITRKRRFSLYLSQFFHVKPMLSPLSVLAQKFWNCLSLPDRGLGENIHVYYFYKYYMYLCIYIYRLWVTKTLTCVQRQKTAMLSKNKILQNESAYFLGWSNSFKVIFCYITLDGLKPCRQLRPSSRREHVNASNNHKLFIKAWLK